MIDSMLSGSASCELSETDRRASSRIRFDCPVRWRRGGADRYGWARDASEAGAGFTVRSLGAPAVGDTIRLVFELDDRYEWVVDEKAVVRRCDPRDHGLCEVGVRLSDLEMDVAETG